MTLPRVILDTNVLLSGLLISQGHPARLLEARECKLFTLVVCPELLAEFREVASRPFFKARLRPSAVEQLAGDLADFSLFITDMPKVAFAAGPKDAYLLGLAEASNAGFLVTGDKALQESRRHKATRIVRPATMVELLREGTER
ncbi:MAG: putative toxin-antitoxin system toxin component, PIN family [Bryobacteraceae bacterium]